MLIDKFSDEDEVMPTGIAVMAGSGHVILAAQCNKDSAWADLSVAKAQRLVEALEQAISKAGK